MTTIDREASTAVVKLPPGPPLPLAVQGVLALANRRIALQIVRRVYRDDAFDDADHSQRHTARCVRSRGARAGATARNTVAWDQTRLKVRADSCATMGLRAVESDARRFDPDRFISRRPDPAEWIPYGGGVRRCIGAVATMEIRVALRTLLRNYVISPSNARDEGWQSRGVALAPARGARVCVRPRSGEANDRL